MTDTKHTPGPWKWEWSDPPSDGSFEAHGLISEADGLNYGTRQVLTVCDGTIYSSVSSDSAYLDVSAANARLIAAAPDLLEFAVMFLGWREYSSHGEFPFDRLAETARAAIAKAEQGQ